MSKNCDVALRRVGRPPFVAIRLHAEPVSDGRQFLSNERATGWGTRESQSRPDRAKRLVGLPAKVLVLNVFLENVPSLVSPWAKPLLEALEHPSLPGGGGPGLYSLSGNFFLTELEMMVAADRIRN